MATSKSPRTNSQQAPKGAFSFSEAGMRQEALDATMASLGSKTTYTGAGVTGVGWVLTSEAAVFVGILVGIIGLVVQTAFGLRRDRRERIEHEARMRRIQAGME